MKKTALRFAAILLAAAVFAAGAGLGHAEKEAEPEHVEAEITTQRQPEPETQVQPLVYQQPKEELQQLCAVPEGDDPAAPVSRGEFLDLAEKVSGIDSGWLRPEEGREPEPDEEFAQRQWAAAVVHRMLLLQGFDFPVGSLAMFEDGYLTKAWAAEAMAALCTVGVIVGDGETLRPGELITRQEAATLLERALTLTP